MLLCKFNFIHDKETEISSIIFFYFWPNLEYALIYVQNLNYKFILISTFFIVKINKKIKEFNKKNISCKIFEFKYDESMNEENCK